jgi:hypothetical protein
MIRWVLPSQMVVVTIQKHALIPRRIINHADADFLAI